MVIERARFDGRFDVVKVNGAEIGFVFLETMDLGDGTSIMLANSFDGYTVSGMSLDELALALLAKIEEVSSYA